MNSGALASWPDALIDELAGRRAIFVLGAGVSASSLGSGGVQPPTWAELISELAELVQGQDDKAIVLELVKSKQYLDAAQVIRDAIAPADFNRVIRDRFEKPNFAASELHKLGPRLIKSTTRWRR